MLRAAEHVLLTGLCVTLAGCGGGAATGMATVAGQTGAPAAAVVPRDVARLRAATLRPEDFPQDWGKTVVAPPRLRCATDNPYSSEAASSSSRLFEQGDRAVQQAVWVFRDARVAGKVFAQTEVRSTRSCLRRSVEEQAHRRRDGRVGALKVIGHQERADSRHARLAGEGHTLVQTALGEMDSIVRVIADVDVTRVGRSISLMVMMSTTRPFAEDIRHHLLHLARQRLAGFAEGPGA
ncbi:MAG: hypothetical protein JWQ18_1614 [Conexibacter sp.]|nr:hypothetical protein [Conexibacter sp.]